MKCNTQLNSRRLESTISPFVCSTHTQGERHGLYLYTPNELNDLHSLWAHSYECKHTTKKAHGKQALVAFAKQKNSYQMEVHGAFRCEKFPIPHTHKYAQCVQCKCNVCLLNAHKSFASPCKYENCMKMHHVRFAFSIRKCLILWNLKSIGSKCECMFITRWFRFDLCVRCLDHFCRPFFTYRKYAF